MDLAELLALLFPELPDVIKDGIKLTAALRDDVQSMLSQLPPSAKKDRLRLERLQRCVRSGIAFHNSGGPSFLIAVMCAYCWTLLHLARLR